ncbi:hypothetical protein WI74_20325 [Burkholderia ubonensis]|nr:hypothetical protein WI74_20325 [Burkholderia ubonensis]
MRRLKRRAIGSLNDHPDIRREFDRLCMETMPIQYMVGVDTVDRNELIVVSLDHAPRPVRLL